MPRPLAQTVLAVFLMLLLGAMRMRAVGTRSHRGHAQIVAASAAASTFIEFFTPH